MAQITQSEVSRATGPWQPLHNHTFRNLLPSNLIAEMSYPDVALLKQVKGVGALIARRHTS